MGSRILGSVAVVALVMAASAAVAATATNKLVGGIKDDANGKVSMKIVVKDGRPVKAKKVKVSNLDYECQDETTGERTFMFAKIALRGTPVGSTNPYFFETSVKNGNATYQISGGTTNGKPVEGQASVRIDNPGNVCTSENLPGDTTENGLYTVKKR